MLLATCCTWSSVEADINLKTWYSKMFVRYIKSKYKDRMNQCLCDGNGGSGYYFIFPSRTRAGAPNPSSAYGDVDQSDPSGLQRQFRCSAINM